jgi:hypothetical protein
VLNKYRSSSSDSSDDDDSDSGDTDSQDQSKKQDAARVLSVPVHSLQLLHDVLPLIAQNPFTQTADAQPSLYTSDAQTDGAPPNSSAASESTPQMEQPRPAPPPMIETSDAPPAPSSEPLSFAAKLSTPAEETASGSPAQQIAQPESAPAGQKQAATPNTVAADADPDPASAKLTADAAIEKVVKIDTPAPQVGQSQPDSSAQKDTGTPAVTAASRMEPLVEAPSTPSGSNHDITVRIPDASERAVDVRFVDRGGEVHVSVRTGDTEMAQTLRSGLNDFASRMDHAGIRAEIWRPGADASSSQNESQNQSFSDPRDQRDQRGSGRNPSGSQDDADDNPGSSSKPKWVEALEKASGQTV